MPELETKPNKIRRNRKYEKRLDSILRAASTVMAADGFEGASMRKVAAEAKIGLSGIYYYFKSKDEMLFALQADTFSRLVDSLRERLSGLDSPSNRLKAIIDNHLQFFLKHMNDLKVCSYEIDSLAGPYFDDVLEIRQRYFRLVRDVIAENIPPNSGIDPNLASLYLFGSLNWIFMWYDAERNSDIAELSDQLLKIYMKGIKAT